MRPNRISFIKKLSRKENKHKFIANYINTYNDDIVNNYITNAKMSRETITDINILKIIDKIGIKEFVNKYKLYLWNTDIESLKYLNKESDKKIISECLMYNLETKAKVTSQILKDKSLDDIKKYGPLRSGTWYTLYHPQLGYLNNKNKNDFENILMDRNNFYKIDFAYNVITVEEILELFFKYAKYDSCEMNLLRIDETNTEYIIDVYFESIKNIIINGYCDDYQLYKIIETEYLYGLEKIDEISQRNKKYIIIPEKRILNNNKYISNPELEMAQRYEKMNLHPPDHYGF